jgi:hypothetical protein
MILLDDFMSVFMGITYDSNDPSRCGESPSPFQSFDAYFFDFMNCFREIQSLLFLVCDDVLKSMKVIKVIKVIKVMSKVARLSDMDQDLDEQF